MIRIIAAASVLAALSSSAFAQAGYTHHTFCLMSGPNKECAFDSMAQCEASKTGNADQCVPNSPPINH